MLTAWCWSSFTEIDPPAICTEGGSDSARVQAGWLSKWWHCAVLLYSAFSGLILLMKDNVATVDTKDHGPESARI